MDNQHSALGYSAVSTFENCPYQYKLRYIDNVEMLDEYDPADALKIGTALHRGIEVGTSTAIHEYYNSYPVISDQHITEAIKLETMIPKVKEVIPEGQHEVFFEYGAFKGTIDLLVPVEIESVQKEVECTFCKNKDCQYYDKFMGDDEYFDHLNCPHGKFDKWYDIYDFKYSNNIDRYMESSQLHVYKYFAEKALGIKIRRLYFVFVQKVQIRQKKTENLDQFRLRLKNTLQNATVQVKEVSYNANKVLEFMENQVKILTCNDYKKQPNKLCDWCEYQPYCEKQEVLNMALPSTNRVEVEKTSKKKIWIYGQPYSGKTTFADQAPTPLNLNTDGNVKYVTMPRLAIKDEVTTEGRITKRKFAWEIFKEAISDLEKGSDFETIVVDLLEDTYEYCRLYMYDQLGITHESDDSFRAWDKVRTEYLSNIKRLLNLDYNIILISHEDTSKDLTKKGGDKVTAIMPNLNEKASKKIAGMVDLVARLVVDGDKRTLNFKSDEVVFGGGRLQGVKTTEIPLSWDSLCEVYNEAIGKVVDKPKTAHQQKVEEFRQEQSEPTPENTEELDLDDFVDITPEPEEKPVRRTRRKRE